MRTRKTQRQEPQVPPPLEENIEGVYPARYDRPYIYHQLHQ
ncbi:MAG TPA: hypothetical protein VEI53_11865 [Ktedonobacteraceae bacterium]|nr:hypothetical protein [Ktedonobacteraceae bacterium]